MKRLSLFSVLMLLLITSCSSSTSETLIAKNQLGLLNPDTQIEELSAVLKNDSIAEYDLESKFDKTSEIEVFNKEGKVSIIIEPKHVNDSTMTINEIQILDPKYETKKGLSVNSTFKTIYENYKIDNIQNSINSVIISIDEIGAYVVIDKKHLPSKLRFDSDIKIQANQIPNEAPLRYFWLRFDNSNL
jgi:hypothetical protein